MSMGMAHHAPTNYVKFALLWQSLFVLTKNNPGLMPGLLAKNLQEMIRIANQIDEKF